MMELSDGWTGVFIIISSHFSRDAIDDRFWTDTRGDFLFTDPILTDGER